MGLNVVVRQIKVLRTLMDLRELDPANYGNEDCELTELSGSQMDAWYHIRFYLNEFIRELEE